ncbi:hypothetical protein [Xenorhabdus sp. KJ12.1]|uniref:hypothetical protein n=1 Tax=Xenorhabdus sp. KJ12.1 TaxID=1851571 RepID=UPI0030D7AADA
MIVQRVQEIQWGLLLVRQSKLRRAQEKRIPQLNLKQCKNHNLRAMLGAKEVFMMIY